MQPPPPTKTVLKTILEWSNSRPAWQRDALRRIVTRGTLNDDDFNELVILCKQGREGSTSKAAPAPLEEGHLPANPGAGASVVLISIHDVDGANALAPSQTLTFAPEGITVVYGDNGAGKSGYARILKRTCRARHAGQIQANIYEPPRGPATATIEYSIGGKQQPPEKWEDSDRPHPTLSAVSVFDTDCASVHIGKQNEVAFRPFGIDVPDELANACKRVKEALAAEQKQLEKARNPLFLKPSWKETTLVGKALSTLKHDTDIAKLVSLAALGDEERTRQAKLREDLSKDVAKAVAEQKVKANNIKGVFDAIIYIETVTSDKALNAVFALDQGAKAKRKAASLAADNAFSGEQLDGIGSESWRALWESARRYSTQSAYPSQPFPAMPNNALCVLCQQPLEEDARERLTRFEKFIQEDTEQQARESEKLAEAEVKTLIGARITTRLIAPNLRDIALQDFELAKQVRRFIASARLRRYMLLRALASGQSQPTFLETATSPKEEVAQLETNTRKYAEELQDSANPNERNKLVEELSELNDRDTLHSLMQMVKEEITRLKTIHFLEQCLADTSTTAITRLGNDLADSVITPPLRDRFQEEIVKLAAEKVRVEIVRTGGQFGSPQYQIRFFANPNKKIADILSEGEKTCVALAAFLTELATASHTSTLVFDDPVSSLDHRWRRQVAKRLVEESISRQIIVFTHDLIFVNDIFDRAQTLGIQAKFNTVSRGKAGAGVVTEGLPWKAQSVEDRLDKLEKDARAAKKLYEANEEAEYAVASVQLYNNLRSTWERVVEEIAFFKIVRRHRDYIDTKGLKKATVLTEGDCDAFQKGFKKCCEITDAHDPSIGRNADPPPVADLLQDVQALKDWIDSMRARQKLIT